MVLTEGHYTNGEYSHKNELITISHHFNMHLPEQADKLLAKETLRSQARLKKAFGREGKTWILRVGKETGKDREHLFLMVTAYDKLTMVLTMKRTGGGQDGYCGNFN